MSQRTATWKERNPDKVAEQKRRWYERHKAEIAVKQAQRHQADPTIKRGRNRTWKAENRYSAAHRPVQGKLSPGLVARLLKLQRGKCACCRRPLGDDYHLDHILPLALGGTNTDDNMQLLRRECNLQKHAAHPVDFMQRRGFLL